QLLRLQSVPAGRRACRAAGHEAPPTVVFSGCAAAGQARFQPEVLEHGISISQGRENFSAGSPNIDTKIGPSLHRNDSYLRRCAEEGEPPCPECVSESASSPLLRRSASSSSSHAPTCRPSCRR